MRRPSLIIFFVACLAALPVRAHQLSTAYAALHVNSQGLVSGEWQVRLFDLEQAVGVDVNGDGNLRWGELQARAQVVQQYLFEQLQIHRGNSICSLVVADEWKIDSHFNESYLLVPVRAQCALAGDVVIHYRAFFNENTEHKLLLTLNSDTAQSSRVLSEAQPEIIWNVSAGDPWQTFYEFVYQGMVHIWIGIDRLVYCMEWGLPACWVNWAYRRINKFLRCWHLIWVWRWGKWRLCCCYYRCLFFSGINCGTLGTR